MVNALIVQITVMLVNHHNNVLYVRKEPLIMMENVINVLKIVKNVKMKNIVTLVNMDLIIMKENVHKNVQRE